MVFSDQQCHEDPVPRLCTRLPEKSFCPITEIRAFNGTGVSMVDSVSDQQCNSVLASGRFSGFPEKSFSRIEIQSFDSNDVNMADSVAGPQLRADAGSELSNGLPDKSFSLIRETETFNISDVGMANSASDQQFHEDTASELSIGLPEKPFSLKRKIEFFNSRGESGASMTDLLVDQQTDTASELCTRLPEKNTIPIKETEASQAFNSSGVSMADSVTVQQCPTNMASELCTGLLEKNLRLVTDIQASSSKGNISSSTSNIIFDVTKIRKPLVTEAREYQTRCPNQYVEHVKYKGNGSDESDNCSECSWDEDEDGKGSNGINCLCRNKVCFKFNPGNACKKHSKLSDNKTHKNPYNNLVTPVSLLDIFCHRLEDDYDFDMDNIIIYVKNIIEQLKSISNGDYLTRETKEKWMGLKFPSQFCTSGHDYNKKTIKTSICMPIHLENEWYRCPSTWKSAVKSGMAVRSFLEVFERNITIEIPKMLTGTYRLFRENSGDISRKQKSDAITHTTSKPEINFTFAIQPSELGYSLSNNHGVAINQENETYFVGSQNKTLLALPCSNEDKDVCFNSDIYLELGCQQLSKTNAKVVEIPSSVTSEIDLCQPPKVVEQLSVTSNDNLNKEQTESENKLVENEPTASSPYSSNTLISFKDVLGKITPTLNFPKSFPFNPTSLEDLKVTMQSLDIQSCLQEESNEDGESSVKTLENFPKERTQVSHNPIHTMEDKRRQRLLEIRETRGKRKRRMIHEKFPQKYSKCAKGHMAPSATSSVTKLSISNKSFYNSIFGTLENIGNGKNQNLRTNCKSKKNKESEHLKNKETSHETETPVQEVASISNKLSTANSKNKEIISDIEYKISDSRLSLKIEKESSMTNVLKRVESTLMSTESSSKINLEMMAKFLLEYNKKKHENFRKEIEDSEALNMLHTTKSLHQLKSSNNRIWPSKVATDSSSKLSLVESRVLDVIEETERVSEKKYPSRANLECRESIDKIYDLMKKIGRNEKFVSTKTPKTKFTTTKAGASTSAGKELLLKDSESGMSTKPSSTSFMSLGAHSKGRLKPNMENNFNVPKVIISVKKHNIEKNNEPEKTVSKFSKDTKHSKQSVLKALPPTLPEIHKNLQELSRIKKNMTKIPYRYNEKTASSLRKNPNNRTSQYDNMFKGVEQDRVTIRNHFKNMRSLAKKKPNVISKSPECRIPADNVDKRLKMHNNNLEDASKEVRGETMCIPCRRPNAASRLEALAQPRKAYVQANSEDLRFKYGRNLISDRLHRLAHATPTQPTQAEMRTQHDLRIRSTLPKDISYINSTNITVIRKNESRLSSMLDTKTTVAEEIKTKAAATSVRKDSVVFGKISSIKPEKTFIKNDHGYIGCQTHEKSNLETTGQTYNSLVPKHSEKGDYKTQATSEKSETSLDSNGSGQLAGISNKIFTATNAENLEADGDKYRIAKIKNGKVVLDPEDLVDSDILNLSVLLESAAKITCRQLVSNSEYKLGSKMSQKEISSNLGDNCMLQISKVSLTSKKSSRNLCILQAGDASTMVTLHRPSMHNLTEHITHYIEPFTMIPDVNNWINLDVTSMPIQIKTVGYSFPMICRQDFAGNSEMHEHSNTINLDRNAPNSREDIILKNADISNVSSLKEINEDIDHEESSRGFDAVNFKKDHEQPGAAPNLDCSSSLDVLVNLLNEIRNISTRQTHMASSINSYTKEEEAQWSNYKVKSTTENGTTCDIVTVSSNEDIKKLEPFSGIYSLYVSQCSTHEEVANMQEHAASELVTTLLEDKCTAVEFPQKELASKCTGTNSQHILRPMTCKATSVTASCKFSKSDINLETKCTDPISFDNILPENLSRKASYQIVSVYKRHSSENLTAPFDNASQDEGEEKCNDGNSKMQACPEEANFRIKRDVLLTVYAVLVLAVFAALSYPDVLLLQS